MEEKQYNFTVLNSEGEEINCDVISIITIESKIYLLYTDYLIDEETSNFRLLASELVQEKGNYILKHIADKELIKTLVQQSKETFEKHIQQ